MIVRLFCPRCAYEVSRSLVDYAEVDVPVPVSSLSDSGEYEVRCGKGHVCMVLLMNLKFELLYEMGLNALVDGYGREAISSFAAALERFYEFYWRVAMAHSSITPDAIDEACKPIARQSERQLGAYISASLLLTRRQPKLLNPNKEVAFRNQVIHNGYVPTQDEAVRFGDAVMSLINDGLEDLRENAKAALHEVYERLLPKTNDDDGEDDQGRTGAVNILTTIDVRHPPKPGEEDPRCGDVRSQMPRILKEREPKRMVLLSEAEMKRRFPDHSGPST